MPRASPKVRVGIIRCDTHGFWYAPLFERPDPDLYRKNHRGCHYYFYRWDDPRKQRIGPVPGMVIARVYDENRSLAEALSEAYRGRPKVCDRPEDVSDDVDLVYIADCSGEGKDHLRYAAPGLKKGVPHFVDKPFAFTLADAREMISLARKHDTAVMCLSLLRASPYLRRFRTRLADIAPVGTIVIPCGGPSLAAVFHGLSTAQNIMGEGCEWVQSMGPVIYDILRLHYPGPQGGTDVIVFNARGADPRARMTAAIYHHCRYHASAYGAFGAAHSPLVGDYRFPDGGIEIVRLAKRMALTRKPPVAYDSMLELMEMIEAARLAHNKGRRVYLEEVRQGSPESDSHASPR